MIVPCSAIQPRLHTSCGPNQSEARRLGHLLNPVLTSALPAASCRLLTQIQPISLPPLHRPACTAENASGKCYIQSTPWGKLVASVARCPCELLIWRHVHGRMGTLVHQSKGHDAL